MAASPAPAGSGRAPVVLHVTAVPYTLAKLLLNQLQYLAEQGYDVRVASTPDSDGFPASLAPFRPLPVAIPRSMRPLRIARGMAQLIRVTWQIRPDILHLHTPAAALPARMLPRVLFPPRMRIAYTVHGYAHTWSGARRDSALQWLEKVLTRRADITLYQSQEDLDLAREHGFRGTLAYLGNGVDDAWFKVADADRGEALHLVFMGRLVREKGLIELLEAVAATPGVRLTIAGSELATDRDGVEAELADSIAALGLGGRVTMTGMLESDDLRTVVGQANVVVLPSYREGVPQSLMQGMAAGRPAIATDIRGCRELVAAGVDGILVPPADVPGLARAVARLRDLPTSEFEAWGRAARSSMAESRRMSAVLGRLSQAYAQILGAGHR
ncbi:MAG: glycosyltransferase [Actinomycetota bacterium]|nr:glycosyltransferase [Actinomycetota bacterium]